MKEKMKGIFVEDYHIFTPDILEEIIQLDDQLNENIGKIIDLICDGDTLNALTNLQQLRDDNITHLHYACKCQEEVLEKMLDYKRMYTG